MPTENRKEQGDGQKNVQYPEWVTLDYVMGQFEPSQHSMFTIIDDNHADRSGLLLRTEAYESFQKMSEAAKEEDIELIIRSATRNFEYQKGIWERKWRGETTLSDGSKASDISDEDDRALKILLYSSMPGTSRHHWGSDIDLNNFNNAYFESGEGLRLYQWLTDNAHKYGFAQPYTDKKDGRSGYEEEKWHWSYLPISKLLTDYCKSHFSNKLIQDFEGSESAATVDMLANYILGIDVNCL